MTQKERELQKDEERHQQFMIDLQTPHYTKGELLDRERTLERMITEIQNRIGYADVFTTYPTKQEVLFFAVQDYFYKVMGEKGFSEARIREILQEPYYC